MKKRKKNIVIALFLVTAAVGIMVMLYSQRRTEIVWYLTSPEYYGVNKEDIKEYEEVKANRFELFNKRLKELGILAKVVFKYEPNNWQIAEGERLDELWYSKQIRLSGEKIKTLIQADSKADIAQFSSMEYNKFLPLDDYFEQDGMKLARKALPEKIWDMNCIQNRTYQIPRGNVCVEETAYYFNKLFLEKYQVTLEEEKIRQMAPEEVVEWLLPYFENERILDGKYYLTSAQDLCYPNYLVDKAIPFLQGNTENAVLNLQTKQVMDVFSTKEMYSALELYQLLYKNNIDAHEETGGESLVPVFTIGRIPNVEELREKQTEDTIWQEVHVGNPHITRSYGNGVLLNSKNQELAVQVLAASVYDEELSNIMIHGVPKEDYNLVDGHAVYTNSQVLSCMGTFSAVGNNLIVYPNEWEVLDKQEKTRKLLQEIPVIPYSNFVPKWDENLLEKMSELVVIYRDVFHTLEYSQVPELETYVAEQQKKLEEAGLLDIIFQLQKQVDCWED